MWDSWPIKSEIRRKIIEYREKVLINLIMEMNAYLVAVCPPFSETESMVPSSRLVVEGGCLKASTKLKKKLGYIREFGYAS